MKSDRLLKFLYLLTAAALVLPWFTYDARIMGFCWGYYFICWFFFPLLVTGVFVFCGFRSRLLCAITEACAAAELAILVMALGRWQEVCNITGGFQWADGLRTALPTYWLAVLIFLLFFAALQVQIFRRPSVQEH
ncbi:MAG: hypothetical protein ACI3VB_03690 [Oscillospiraceae bacterium]